MTKPGFWAVDPNGEQYWQLYEDLEVDTRKKLIKPIGGFIFPAGAFMAMDLVKAPFVVKDILPKRGKAVVYAPTKSGKSWLCLTLARSVIEGEPFLGLPTQRGRVLYIQFELGEEVLQERLLNTGQLYDNFFVGTSFDIKLDTTAGQKRIHKAIDVVEPDLLIIDPLYKGMSGDENEKQDMMGVLDFLDELIDAYRCSIFMVHHSGKDLTKRGRGSTALEDWVDSYLSMRATNKKGEPLKIKLDTTYLRHAPPWEEPIMAELRDFEFVPVAGAQTVKQKVLNFIIGQRRVVKTKEIFDKHLGGNTSVYEALDELITEGKLFKMRQGEYASA